MNANAERNDGELTKREKKKSEVQVLWNGGDTGVNKGKSGEKTRRAETVMGGGERRRERRNGRGRRRRRGSE